MLYWNENCHFIRKLRLRKWRFQEYFFFLVSIIDLPFHTIILKPLSHIVSAFLWICSPTTHDALFELLAMACTRNFNMLDILLAIL